MASSYSYSVLRYITDDMAQTSVPVGVVVWADTPAETRIRVAGPGEHIKGFKSSGQPFVRLVKAKIEHWVSTGSLPYADASVRPGSDEWWRHMSTILVHNVQLSEPRAIDCVDPNQEVELLYEAVVGSKVKRDEKLRRIDSQISNALGEFANQFDRGDVKGFKGKPVPVRRFKEHGKNLLVIDGVNLTAIDAVHDTDALVSKLLRIKEADNQRKAAFLVGYLASPNGLNGEAFLVEWIEKKLNAKTFDLIKNISSFTDEVKGQLSRLS